MSDPLAPADGDPGADRPPRAPRWVITLGFAVLILVLAVVVAMVLLGGQHGPGRHG